MSHILEEAFYSQKTENKSAHFHDCHQLIYVTAGSAEIYVNQTAFTVHAGELAMVSRYESHTVHSCGPVYHRYVVRIAPFVDHRQYAMLLNRPDGFRNVVDVSRYRQAVTGIFRHLVEERSREEPLAQELEQLLLQQLLLYIHRCQQVMPGDEAGRELVYGIQRQFEQDCSRNYVLGTLARENCVSVSTLSHQFRQITGYSVFSYLTGCRIARAKEALAETALPVSRITEQCGFSDSSNFSRTFRRYTGLSPTAFREKYRK